MKRLFAIGIVLLSLMGCGSRNAQKSTESTSETNSDAAVEVFIFHAAQRCATCKAIDAVVAEFRRVRDEIRLKMQDFYLTEINRNNL